MKIVARWFVAASVVATLGTAATGATADCGPSPGPDAMLIAEPTAAAAIAEARAGMPNAEGRLWRVETEPPSYLVGTFHLAAGGIAQPGETLTALVTRASGLYLELESSTMTEELARWSANPKNIFRSGDSSFTDAMSPAEREHAEEVLAGYGMPLVVAEQMRPLILVGLLSLPPCALAEADAPGLDEELERIAVEADVEVSGLETVAEQIDALEGQPEVMDQILRMTLSLGADDRAMWFTNIALYRTRHIGAIWTMGLREMAALVGEDEAERIGDVFWEAMVARRNRTMLQRMLPGLREGGKVVAVGALHLPGEDGLVALLREAGLRVTRVASDPHTPAPPRLGLEDPD
ncbi:TraB/GumN family protein [Acuticoccus sp. I52.16.1]|uniref:TraB/GumN family protein n=1 Tax=Acuticoccus sp. I52.16.1 TaxID=2928472 RepID=UPI001FD38072|nr:TraB/GumN family protein [Acuticoccus sp. I52.16.1]UOM35950.1 TraB/GumN family protein [Acuticoccus sp. I52.16.1]